MPKLNVKKIGILFTVGIVALFLIIASSSFFENVKGGEIHVKQAAISGNLTVHVREGLYSQMFGKITKYYRTYETYLSTDVIDGGEAENTDATQVRFGDGGTAAVSSVTQWRLPLTDEELIKIHRNYRSFDSLAAQVRQWIIEVEKQTSSTFKADETYSTRRGEFSQLISDQITNGLYITETKEVETPTNEIDANGNPVMATTTRVVIKRDDEGNPLVSKKGIFREYSLELVNHTLKDIDYDETIDGLIAQKKKAEQEKAVAITNAEKARQDAITAEETGKARIAEARANEEVKKITGVTQAEAARDVAILQGEQKLRVAELDRQAAEQNAQKELALRRADAEANALLVKAGLTPLQKAEIERDTRIGVAREIAKLQLPSAMVIGGSGSAGMDPLTAVGVNQMLDIVERLGAAE